MVFFSPENLNSEFSELNPEYLKTIKSKYKSAIQNSTIADVMNAYANLIDKKMFQYALILHLMYSVGISSDTLVLITYDSLNDSGILKYLDTLNLAYVVISLNENLVWDILHFKEIVRKIKSEAKNYFVYFKINYGNRGVSFWIHIISDIKDLQDDLVEIFQTLNILPIKLFKARNDSSSQKWKKKFESLNLI